MAQPSTTDCNEKAASDEISSTACINPMVKIKEEKIDSENENQVELLKYNVKIEPPDNIKTQKTNGHQNQESDEESDDSDSSSQEQENGFEDGVEAGDEEKKNIEPVKSSNEILTELFKVFNVAPPEELLDDKNLIKKAKKSRKEKKKKHKKSKDELFDSDTDEDEVVGDDKLKHKKSKKKHRHKHKEDCKDKSKERDKMKSIKSKDRERERAKSKDNESKPKGDKRSSERERSKERGKSRDRAKSKDRDKKIGETPDKFDQSTKLNIERKRQYENEERSDSVGKRKKPDSSSSYNGLKERGNSRERNDKEKMKIKTEPRERRRRRNSEDISDISLSDEETYLKEKETRVDHMKRKVHNSFYESRHRHERGYSRDRYRDRDRERKRDRERDRDREKSYRSRVFSGRYHSRYSRSRSRSRSRSHDLGIDKKRLLEIARKNAISMFKRGNLPGCDKMSQEIKDKVLLKMRYGGRTVEDLTEFCKKISNGENLSDLTSDEDSDVDKAGNSKAFHHPFQLKEREPIVMHIRNSKPILPILSKTEEQTKAITMQFPVSSGQQHRMTEHWVPVDTKDNLAPLPALATTSQSTALFKNNLPKNALGKPLPVTEEQEPAFKPVPASSSEPILEASATVHKVNESVPVVVPAPPPVGITVPPPPPPPPPPMIDFPANLNTTTSAPAFVPDVPVPSTNSSIFPQTNFPALDVSSIISKRLNAMRRLQENPTDSEALKMMQNSQMEMSTWASSKYLPGQFTGSTGANVLKPSELNSGPQVWARRDQLTSSKPVTGGLGMHLLQKMGWKPGEGLGREKNGSLQPLLLDVKLDKRGLVAQDDRHRKGMPMKKRGPQSIQSAQQTIEGKHPVCLLNELTSKRKWTPPLYTLVNENGPSHSKMFLFSVQVNGQTFTPDKACNTKKEAKMVAAKRCLQEIGILPKC